MQAVPNEVAAGAFALIVPRIVLVLEFNANLQSIESSPGQTILCFR